MSNIHRESKMNKYSSPRIRNAMGSWNPAKTKTKKKNQVKWKRERERESAGMLLSLPRTKKDEKRKESEDSCCIRD